MKFPAAKWRGFALVLGFAGWGLAGCATQPPETVFTPVSTQRGVIRWQQGVHAITGNVVFSRDAQGTVRMQWDRSKEASTLEMLLTPDGKLSASGALTDRPWSGPVDRAPPSLSSWTNFLATYQHAADLKPGFQEIHSPAYRMAYEKTSLGLQSLSVASTDLHESIAAVFVPRPEADRPKSHPSPL